MPMNNPDKSVNIISPIIDLGNSEELFNKIPTVKNTADLNPVIDDNDDDIDFILSSRSYWDKNNPKQLSFYNKGIAAGRHAKHDIDLVQNSWKILTTIKMQVLNDLVRSNEKSISEIKYILDVLNILDNNIQYIINNNKIKINNNELLAYMHGFINSIVNNQEI